ncbi:MAG: 2-oxo acid dehydrogenase subunit E2 [Nitrospirae bacterium]|nr:2-oxo acid dehydrogenase subunit E2 [Nitrospirota bacterium]
MDIIMPQMGESVVEGAILRWLVSEGEKVKKDQPIVEISTDKVDTEIPSPAAGVLRKILHGIDETVPVGTVLALLEEVPEDVVEEAEPAKVQQTPAAEVQKTTIEVGVEIEKRYSPLVRRLAKEYGVDLKNIMGSGAGGRVSKQDLLDYIAGIQRTTIQEEAAVKGVVEAEKAIEEILPLSPMRKMIAERMVQSKNAAPHVTTTFEVDMTGIARYRETNKDAVFKSHGVHLTYLPFIIFASASALKEYPVLNSSWSDNGIVIKKYINIGIAVSLEDGLIVPVIKGADTRNLIELAKEGYDLAQRARNKRLKVEEVQNSTFTITNYGISGSLFGTPIIMPPHAAILGIGAITKRPVIINDSIAIRQMVYLSLSFDHRVTDGAQADKFLSKIKDILEGWGGKSEKVPPVESGYGGVW